MPRVRKILEFSKHDRLGWYWRPPITMLFSTLSFRQCLLWEVLMSTLDLGRLWGSFCSLLYCLLPMDSNNAQVHILHKFGTFTSHFCGVLLGNFWTYFDRLVIFFVLFWGLFIYLRPFLAPFEPFLPFLIFFSSQKLTPKWAKLMQNKPV